MVLIGGRIKTKQNTQTHTKAKLPSRSPELVVTKTQLSLGRKRRRRICRFRIVFTDDLLSLVVPCEFHLTFL